MSFNTNEIALKKLRDDYFNQVISIGDYRHGRKQLLDIMEVQLNGRHNASTDSQELLSLPPKEDSNPFQ